MKLLLTLCCLFLLATSAAAAGSEVGYEVDGVAFEGYYVAPAANAPLVLLVHYWDGLGDYEIKRAEMLGALGYAVFAADLFGKGVRPATMDGRRLLTGALYADRPRMRALLQGALAAAKKQGARIDNAVAVGYCFGGAAVLELARPGAPLRNSVGSGYLLFGEVKSARDCRPIAGARIEVWLVGPDGRYDERWRATVQAGADERYYFSSHVPPPYGSRPPHIHLIVNAPGFAELITQHYPAPGTGMALFDLVLLPQP